jgi:hypothetical protein
MTAQEQQMLQGLADRLNRTQLADKDGDAEQFIEQTLGRNPDALYVMAQTVLVQQYALEQAQRQLADLKAQLEQARQHGPEAKHSGSFLGNLLGFNAESSRPAAPPPPPPAQAQYAPAPVYAQPVGYPAQGGGFLRSAMQTATGVAAGALAFEGIESLMHGFGHAAGYGTEFVAPGSGAAGFGGGFEGAPREEIVNNYYGNASPQEHGGYFAGGRDTISDHPTDASQLNTASDGNDGGRLQDASYVADTPGGASMDADALSGTAGSDYSADADDSMLADDVGSDPGSDSSPDGGFDGGGDDSSGFDGGGDFGGGDSNGF